MMDCTNCNRQVEYPPVPFVVHENMRAQMDLTIRRLIRVLVLLIILLVGSNMAWLLYEEQFDTVRAQQENERGVNNFIGNDGDITNGNADDYLP